MICAGSGTHTFNVYVIRGRPAVWCRVCRRYYAGHGPVPPHETFNWDDDVREMLLDE